MCGRLKKESERNGYDVRRQRERRVTQDCKARQGKDSTALNNTAQHITAKYKQTTRTEN